MSARKGVKWSACAVCVALLVLNDLLSAHLRLDSPPQEAASCPSSIHISRADSRVKERIAIPPTGDSRIGMATNGRYAWVGFNDVSTFFGIQSARVLVGFQREQDEEDHPEPTTRTLHAGESMSVEGVGSFTLEEVHGPGILFGTDWPWATVCFAPDPAFTVDPPILWRNKLIPGLHPPPHLWGSQDDAPYNDPDPASGATAPPAPRNVAPPTTPQSSTAPNAPAADTAEDAGTTTTGGR